MGLLVGHDLGTHANKAVLLDESGRILAKAVEPYGIQLSGHDRAEQDPEVWWQAVCLCTRRLLEASGRAGSEVDAIGFAGQMLALVPMDEQGRPTRPAISWLDSRAEVQAARVIRMFGGKTIVSMLAGAIPSGKDLVCKIAWLRDEEPEVFARTALFGDATSYLVTRATGTLSIDVTCAAGTGMLDPKSRSWSSLLAWLSRFPLAKAGTPRECTEPVGTLTREAAEALGLSTRAIVVAGLADIPAAALGSGCVSPNDAHIYLGTSGWLGITTATPAASPEHGIAALPWTVPGTSLTIAEMENAGSCLDWAMRQVLFRDGPQTAETYRAFEALAATAAPGANDLFFLPWLYGERSPFPSERLRGGWMGASLTTRSADLARSVFEGVAYNLAWSLQAMAARGVRPTSLAALGGGALSDLWLQSMADASGLPVLRLAEPRTAGAVGAALCAGVGAGQLASLGAIKEMVQWERRFEPDGTAHALHRERLPRFARLAGWMEP